MAWFGLPGGAIGGMNPRAGDAVQWHDAYCFSSDLDAMLGVPMAKWATKSFTARRVAAGGKAPEAELAEEEQLLVGSVTNTLDYTLEDCILAYGRSVYELGTLAPGESARLGAMSKRSELKTLLTGRKVVAIDSGDKYRQQATPYDQSSADVLYILRAMMFYDASGGRRYTGLLNSYQKFVDLSSTLLTDRAIMIARPASGERNGPGAELLLDGRPVDESQVKRAAIYRFVFKVKK